MEAFIHGDPIWVDTPDQLQRMAADLHSQRKIAIDTESNSLFAYQEQICLIQFSTPQHDYLLDPFQLDDLSSLADIFESPHIEKVFHAAEYDIICLKRDYCFQFANLFDTMQSARILGLDAVGLGSLLETEFEVITDKHFQRANWAKRPLTHAMLQYARMDTHYLIPLRDILHARLIEKDRLELAEEDFTRLTHILAGQEVNDEAALQWWRISSSQELTPRQAGVLLQLCRFRNNQARSSNQPAFRILSNQMLLEIAREMPRKRSELNDIKGLPLKLIQRYGDGLLHAVEKGITGAPAYRPFVPKPEDHLLKRMEVLRTWRKATAKLECVESDIILPKDVLETIAAQNPHSLEELGRAMQDVPWRFEHFGSQILNVLTT